MDSVTNVVSWLLKAKDSLPTKVGHATMDMDRKAWTIELEYLTTGMATAALGERLGVPDSSIPLVGKRWTFAGCTIIQRGKQVTVLERY